MKPCYGKCERCAWYRNGGCSEWIIANWYSNYAIVHECPLYKCCNDQPSDNIEDWLKSPVEVDV